MTTEQDPPRLRTLRGELPPELLVALDERGDEAPTRAELVALERRVRDVIGATDGGLRPPRFVPPRPAPGLRVGALVLSFAIGAGAGVLVSGGLYVVSKTRAATPVTAPTPAASSQERSRPHAVRTQPPPVASVLGDQPPDAASPPRPAPEPGRVPKEQPALDLPSASPSSGRGDREELALVARAQRALSNDPTLALSLVRDHERKFPNGTLVQEREMVAIEALLALGRREEAERRAIRFRRQFPASVHDRRLDVLLGSGGPPSDHN